MKTIRQGTTFYIRMFNKKHLCMLVRFGFKDELHIVDLAGGNRWNGIPIKSNTPTKEQIISNIGHYGDQAKFIKFRKIRSY